MQSLQNNQAEPVAGFLLVRKPVGITSFQIVRKLRYITQVKKIGHAGTLDPFASGLVILAIGKQYTRLITNFLNASKEYRATLVLGIETDSYDCDGKSIQAEKKTWDISEIERAVLSFKGNYAQTPPAFSAKKIKGKKAYELARKGEPVKLKPQLVTIFEIEIKRINNNIPYPVVEFIVKCAKGTYIRSLARDIGVKLGSVAYLKDLCRTKIADHALKDALDYKDLNIESIKKKIWNIK
ncbi:tRNA pseudouridine(55) synthase TruB [bacterium]|nr:tRNA pseudouridine(55) synthase TruB [bacterium]MBT4552170.1 tRNA pseudouridine(55) synthase TruB [bacterium]